MGSQMQRFQPCQYSGGCTRGTNDPSHLCHKHRHQQKGYTRGGQLVFSSGGPLGVLPRLAKESKVAPPKGDDSMEVEGFPYFSVLDQKHYVDWSIGIAPRPSNADVIDRFPIQVNDVPGSDITGDEIGVYDAEGTLFTFNHEAVPEETSGLIVGDRVRIFLMENGKEGTPFAISSQGVYQVVVFDRDKLGSHL